MRTIFNNKGISLIVLIVIMLGMAIIGGGVAAVMSSKQKSYPFAVNSYKAYEIANAGAEFAIGYCRNESAANCQTNIKGANFTASFGGGSFTTSYNSGTDTITSVGTYGGVTREVRIANFSTYASSGEGPTFDSAEDMASFVPVESASSAFTVDPATKIIKAGEIGGGNPAMFGSVWYGGDNAAGNCVEGKCDFMNGFRAFFVFSFKSGSQGEGFTFAVTNGADNHRYSTGGDSAMGELLGYGGDSRIYDTEAKYIRSFLDGKGYGLRPPKFAVEFDIVRDSGCENCPGSPDKNNRCDPPGYHMAYVFWGDEVSIGCKETQYTKWASDFYYPINSVVYVDSPGAFYRTTDGGTSGSSPPPANSGLTWVGSTWTRRTAYSVGDTVVPTNRDPNGYYYNCTTAGNSGNSEPTWCTGVGCTVADNDARWTAAGSTGFPGSSKTYDDNKHNAGTGTNPSTSTSYVSNAFNIGTIYAFRIEVARSTTTKLNGNYNYTIRSWLKPCGTLSDSTNPCSAVDPSFSNLSADYTLDTASPYIVREIELTPAYHAKFEKFLFGWTMATSGGGSHEMVELAKFKLNFIQSYNVWNNLGTSAYFRKGSAGSCYQILNNASISAHTSIGRIGKDEYIQGFTDSSCSTPTSTPSIIFVSAKAADTNKNFSVNFTGTDR